MNNQATEDMGREAFPICECGQPYTKHGKGTLVCPSRKYASRASQPVDTTGTARKLLNNLVVELEIWEPHLLEVLRLAPETKRLVALLEAASLGEPTIDGARKDLNI